jgi:hypothetical protein
MSEDQVAEAQKGKLKFLRCGNLLQYEHDPTSLPLTRIAEVKLIICPVLPTV